MGEIILKVISENLFDIIIAIISITVSYYIIPMIKKDLIPWLKEKRIYDMVVKLVKAVEKMAETGVIEKCDKKREVIKLLQSKGIEVTEEIDALIESAVKELDLITLSIQEEINRE